MKIDDLKQVGPKGTLAERFHAKVRIADGCWEWQACRTPDGYGVFRVIRANGEPLSMRAHRMAWLLAHGELPDDRQLAHKCDNPPCVRIDHLFPATAAENTADMMIKGRAPIIGRLTYNLVLNIRWFEKIDRFTTKEMAQRYGVSTMTIRNAIQRKTWKHVP